MKLHRSLAHVTTLALIIASLAYAQDMKLTYPQTRQADVVDDYHGVKIQDPFRWLEDDNSAETKAWVDAQNKITSAFLERIPERPKIRKRLAKLWNYERFGIPHHQGGRYFYSRNSGLQNQSVIYVAESLSAEPRLLLDPNLLSPDGTVALSGYAISDDGKLMAYGISRAGSDWQEWRVRDVATGTDREDLVEWVKFSNASWKKDGSGFFYSRYDAPKEGDSLKGKNEFQKLFFHRLGTPQKEDQLIYERRDHADWGFGGVVTDDGRYLVIHVSQGTETKNRVFYKDLTEPDSKVVELLNDFEASYGFIDNAGPVFIFSTDLDAPRSRVIAIDIRQPEREHWKELIPESEDALTTVNLVGGQILCEYLHDAHSLVRSFAWEGKPERLRHVRDLELPGLGSVGGLGGKAGDRETFYSFTSFTTPGTIYRLDLASGENTIFREPHVDFDHDAYETRQVFAKSKDGTRVPIFLVHRRGLVLDGSHPTLLYGYGGFNINLTPGFGVSTAVWLEMGGVYAMANLRGGGEYGIEWHNAGIREKKQNVFDDFIAAAEWLIAEKYTESTKLAIMGGSNGGLLVGACMTQRPELFGAAIPAVGVLDMLRFHRFTIGWAWKSDYGSSEDVVGFRSLLAYSPLHQLKPGVRYPATLIITADHDDRVVPAHSFKFAAQLQAVQAPDGPPVLIRIDVRAGHGAGKPITKVIDTATDQWAFLVKVLGMRLPW